MFNVNDFNVVVTDINGHFIRIEELNKMIECAAEIAKVDAYNLLIYIQKEVWLSSEGIDYQRAIELLKQCIYDIEEREHCEDKLLVQALDNIGFYDSEIDELGFGYLFNNKEEE